jgi:hypothetical protein
MIASRLGLRGSAEFEVMWWHGRFHIIEVNPRFSGMTNLSIAISGANTYTALALGTGPPRVSTPRFVAEVPLVNMDEGQRSEVTVLEGVLSVEGVRYHDGSSQWKLLFTALDGPTALAALTLIAESFDIIAPTTLAEFARCLGDSPGLMQ